MKREAHKRLDAIASRTALDNPEPLRLLGEDEQPPPSKGKGWRLTIRLDGTRRNAAGELEDVPHAS